MTDIVSDEQIRLHLAGVRPATIFNEQTGRLESDPTAPPYTQAQNDETLLEMELMGDFLARKEINRVNKVKTALDEFKSGETSYVAAINNLDPLRNFDSVGWRQHLEAALQETQRTDRLNFRRIRMLQSILSRSRA